LVLTDVQAGEVAGHPVRAVDIRDFPATRAAMEGVDHVVHLAIGNPFRMERTRPVWERDDEMMQVGVQGTQHVFEAARQAGARRVVFASSMTVYPLYNPKKTIEPATPTQPQNLYACTKLFGEALAEVYARESGMAMICLRFGQPFPLPPGLKDQRRVAKARHRWLLLGWSDMVESVRCALDESGPRFAIANIISDNDVSSVDPLDAPRLGYRPRQRFTAESALAELQKQEKGASVE
ncbi:MAG: NAD-dependent epimerase/dehydratase family protein, partial [Phycisphaeraceae bacterium]